MFLLNLFQVDITILCVINLHSTMFLLNLVEAAMYNMTFTHLHSTMFLLNPGKGEING